MTFRILSLGILLSCTFAFGQLPEREELVAKFVKDETNLEGATELMKHFQSGGIRTIMRNLEKISPELREKYGRMLSRADLLRFRNDLNAKLGQVEDPNSKAVFLNLLASIGRELPPSVFEPMAKDETLPLSVRLAAHSGLIKVQNPKIYDAFHEVAEDAIYDPTTGQNDFFWAHLVKSENNGFYLYTRGKLYADKVKDGTIKAAIMMAENESTDMYTALLDLRKRKFVPMMIDRAVQVGGTALLDLMAEHKFTRKKYASQIAEARKAAAAIQPFRSRFMDKADVTQTPLGALVPVRAKGSGAEKGYPSGYAIIKVSKDGVMSVESHHNPFGGSDNIKDIATGTTLPGYVNWEPVDTYYLVVAM